MELVCTIPDQRLDVFLAESVDGLSRSGAQNLLEGGHVTVNGKVTKKNYRTAVGDLIRVELQPPEPLDIQATPMELKIVYEDADVIVIDKPKGLVVHPAAGHQDDTLVNGLMYARGDTLSGINGIMRPGIVHRIDKDTSGLLIVAKHDTSHLFLANQLKDHTLARVYEAVVCGTFQEDRGTVDAPIGRHPSDRKRMAVTDRGKNAVTHWEVITRYRGYTHIRCSLETGRTHQIRVHMAHLGHPILGDTVYGRKKPELGQDTQCLHARRLSFMHPTTGQTVEVETELPQYFLEVLEKLRKMTP